MPWNNGAPGGSPWGTPGGGSQDGPRNNAGGGGPWGSGRGPGPGNGRPPELDDLIEKVQGYVRSILPPGRGGGRRGGRGSSGRLVLFGAIAIAGLWIASGFYRVQPDEQGVVLRFGAFHETTLPGLNYRLPWPIDSVQLLRVTRVNRVDIGYRAAAERGADRARDVSARDVAEESQMLTGDENIVDIDCSVFWRVRDAGAYLFATRNPDLTVKSAAESVMREVIGRTPIQPALTDARAQIENSVMSGVQAILDQYGTGVEVTQVQLQKVDPPAEVIDSFRDVQRANTDAERMRNEAEAYRNDILPRARGDAARMVAEATGAKQASVAEATGQTQRFLSVLHAYQAAKDITVQRLYLETMQDILSRTPSLVVDDRLKGVVPYLPLGDVAGARPQVPPPPVAGTGAKGATP